MSRAIEWAENEVRIALERESVDCDFYGYDRACYDSALKAYTSLCEDGHSGLSIQLTKNVLDRLVDRKPITPIEDTAEVWVESPMPDVDYKCYQCRRMGSFWKHVFPDGRIEYIDTNRARGVDIHSGATYTSGLVRRIVDEISPIEMPYYPPTNGTIFVRCEDFLLNPGNGDFDTVRVYDAKFPDGKNVEINRAYTESPEGWKEISLEELERMLKK